MHLSPTSKLGYLSFKTLIFYVNNICHIIKAQAVIQTYSGFCSTK